MDGATKMHDLKGRSGFQDKIFPNNNTSTVVVEGQTVRLPRPLLRVVLRRLPSPSKANIHQFNMLLDSGGTAPYLDSELLPGLEGRLQERNIPAEKPIANTTTGMHQPQGVAKRYAVTSVVRLGRS